MIFSYKAKNKEGEIVSEVIEVASKTEFYQALQKKELILVSVEEKKSSIFAGGSITIFKRVSAHEKVVLARNIAVMLNAGLPLSRALTIIGKQTKNVFLKKILSDVEDAIRTGKTFHEALAMYPKVFSSLFVSMAAAGEESGKLADALQVVGNQMEKAYLLTKKVRGALLYPGIIITAMIGIGIFMLMFVVPTLTSTFRELNVELPATTRFIILISDLLQNHFILILIGVGAVIFGLWTMAKTAKGKSILHALSLRIPVIGELIKEVNAARTARTLSSLLTSGVSMIESLRITSDVLQNPAYKKTLKEAGTQVQVGAPISDVFSKASKIYPIYVSEMMAVGEETGELGPMLQKVAQFFEDEVDQKTKDMSTIIEPFLMLAVGVAVGFFALSMITPMYSLVNNI
jgi:type IV pilus assembly protein PilC